MKLLKTNNQWSLAVRLLIENYSTGVDMKIASRDIFYKFQSRLGETEKGRVHKIKVRRLRMKSKNRFGHEMSWINYKSLASKEYLIGLHNKLVKFGTKALHR
mgnify:CR=1 FL=1